MRSYSVDAVAVAIGATPKWVDNLLSHHTVRGVVRSRRGVERRISDEGALAIELIHRMARGLDLPLARAAHTADIALRARTSNIVRVLATPGVSLEIEIATIQASLQAKLVDAVSAVPRRRRGRIPGRHADRLGER